MKHVHNEIIINASPTKVWNILIDLPRYKVWNPYIFNAQGTVREGEGFVFTTQLPRAASFRHFCRTLRLIPEKEWTYRALWMNIPGFLFSEHCIQLNPQADGSTRLVSRGHYTGLLVFLFWRWYTLSRIVEGIKVRDGAIKRAAEGEGVVERETLLIEKFGGRDKTALARMRGSWAVVTGASSGIGREYAVQLAQAGVHIVLVARREDILRGLAKELETANGVQTQVVALDLTAPEAPEELYRRVKEKGIRPRFLANVAGVDSWGYFEDSSLGFHRRMMRLNAEVPMALCHLFRADLASHLTSSIVNVSSIAAYSPLPYMAVYSAAKAFLQSFSQAIFGEWFLQGIHVQTVVAGPTATNIGTLHRLKEYGIYAKAQSPGELVNISLSRLVSREPVIFPAKPGLAHRVFGKPFQGRLVLSAVARRFRPPGSTGGDSVSEQKQCIICGNTETVDQNNPLDPVPSNVREFQHEYFSAWRCRKCLCIHLNDTVDLARYYENYPVHTRVLNFAQWAAYMTRLRLLVEMGVKKDHRILDYGCSSGAHVNFLRAHNFYSCFGYDRFVKVFSDESVLQKTYDAVISYDVIEHDPDPAAFLHRLASLTAKDGLLVVATPNAAELALLDRRHPHLHQPYHLHILSEKALVEMAAREGFVPVRTVKRWYFDTLWPFVNGRFVLAYLRKNGVIDAAFEKPQFLKILLSPRLLFLGLFGYFFRARGHMTLCFRRGDALPHTNPAA